MDYLIKLFFLLIYLIIHFYGKLSILFNNNININIIKQIIYNFTIKMCN